MRLGECVLPGGPEEEPAKTSLLAHENGAKAASGLDQGLRPLLLTCAARQHSSGLVQSRDSRPEAVRGRGPCCIASCRTIGTSERSGHDRKCNHTVIPILETSRDVRHLAWLERWLARTDFEVLHQTAADLGLHCVA